MQHLYPNPFWGTLTLNVEESEAKASNFKALGQSMGNWNLAMVENKLDTRALAPGIYFVQVKTSSGSATKKLVKE